MQEWRAIFLRGKAKSAGMLCAFRAFFTQSCEKIAANTAFRIVNTGSKKIFLLTLWQSRDVGALLHIMYLPFAIVGYPRLEPVHIDLKSHEWHFVASNSHIGKLLALIELTVSPILAFIASVSTSFNGISTRS